MARFLNNTNLLKIARVENGGDGNDDSRGRGFDSTNKEGDLVKLLFLKKGEEWGHNLEMRGRERKRERITMKLQYIYYSATHCLLSWMVDYTQGKSSRFWCSG